MTDWRSPARKIRDRRIEIVELRNYYKEKVLELQTALVMLDAAITDVERCAT